MKVSRRHFLGLTSIVTLKSFTTGPRALASNPLQIFEIKVFSGDEHRPEAHQLSSIFEDLTRGLVLQHHTLQAEFRIQYDGRAALTVTDTTTGQISEAHIPAGFDPDTNDVHDIYALALQLAVQMAPNEVYLVRSLCDYFTAFRKYEEGIECFKDLSRCYPHQSQLSFQLGILSDRAGHKQEAYDIFRQVHLLDPDDPLPMYNLGVVAADLGRINEAENWFQKTLIRSPGMKTAQARLDRLRRKKSVGTGKSFKLDVV